MNCRCPHWSHILCYTAVGVWAIVNLQVDTFQRPRSASQHYCALTLYRIAHWRQILWILKISELLSFPLCLSVRFPRLHLVVIYALWMNIFVMFSIWRQIEVSSRYSLYPKKQYLHVCVCVSLTPSQPPLKQTEIRSICILKIPQAYVHLKPAYAPCTSICPLYAWYRYDISRSLSPQFLSPCQPVPPVRSISIWYLSLLESSSPQSSSASMRLIMGLI